MSHQTRGFTSWPEELDCSPYIKSLDFEGLDLKSGASSRMILYGMQAKKKKKTLNKQQKQQPTSNYLGSIPDYHTPYRPQCPSGSGEHGLQRAGGNMLEATWRETFPPLKKDPASERLLLAQCLMWKGLANHNSRFTQYSSKSVSISWNILRWSPREAVIEIRNLSFGTTWICKNIKNSFHREPC